MPTVIFTEAARQDLLGIWDYVATSNPGAADDVLDRIEQTCRRTADNPLSGRSRDQLIRGMRSVPTGSYVVFYRPLPDGIRVIRVLHGARDLDKVFHE